MDKIFIFAGVLLLIIASIIGSNQRTIYEDNERLLVMVEDSQELADSYKKSYEAIRSQYDKLDETYIKQIAEYKAILDRDEKLIYWLEQENEMLEKRLEELTKAYTDIVN